MAVVMPEDRSIDESVHALDARLHRVEQAVAALSDTQLMEDRIVERVAHRTDPHQNGGLLAGAAKLFKGGVRKPDAEPAELPPPPEAITEPPPAKPGWLLLEFIQEIRAAMRMFADYRYRMSWTGRIVPLACVILGVLSFFIIRLVPLVGSVLDFVIDFVLIVILYKALSREVERYESGAGRVLR
jgi:hypothetical protein